MTANATASSDIFDFLLVEERAEAEERAAQRAEFERRVEAVRVELGPLEWEEHAKLPPLAANPKIVARRGATSRRARPARRRVRRTARQRAPGRLADDPELAATGVTP